jgi:competence protein ComEC
VTRAWALPLAAGAFWTGIFLEGVNKGGPSPATSFFVLALGLVGIGATLVPRGRAYLGSAVGLVLILSFGLLGTGWAGVRDAHVRASPLAALAGRSVTVLGSIESPPARGMFGWTASMRVEFVIPRAPSAPAAAIRLSDPVWLEGHGLPPNLRPGDRVAVDGTLAQLRGSFGAYLRHRGYPAVLSADRLHDRGPPRSFLRRAANRVRGAFGQSLQRVFPRREAGLLMGLALGDTSRLDPRIEESFRATGLSHLTAVSGENLAMFTAPILGAAMLLRLGRSARLLVGVVAVVFFVLLTGGEPSVLRAAAMAGLTLLGVFLGRPRSPPAILAGAVLLLLGNNPTLVYSIGFRLSVAATAGIAVLAGPLSDRFRWLPRGLALAAATTIAAQAGVTPLLLYHFGVVPLVSVPANLLAFPAVGPAMILGLLAAALGTVAHPVGVVIGVLARLPLGYLEGLAQRLARSPLPSVTSAGGHLPELLVGLLVLGGLAWWIRTGARLHGRAVAVALFILPLFVWSSAVRSGPPATLTVTFFDVGQGDAALVRSPAGASILIDGGPDPDLVVRKLAALGIRRLDLIVATHQHADHVGGLPSVLARFPVGLVLDPGCRDDAPAYAAFLSAVRSAGVSFRHPRSGAGFLLGDVSVEVLGPDRCFNGTNSDPNNDSLVLRVVVAGSAVLFPGDAEQPNQAELLRDEAALLPAQVLKVPHHGGATSSPSFFKVVHASVAIVSVGMNRYGHPAASVLQELARDGMRVFRTDRSGDVTVSFRGGDVLVDTET